MGLTRLFAIARTALAARPDRAIYLLYGVRNSRELVFEAELVDPSMAVGYAYGMLDEQARDASNVRATYFIDPEGIIRALTWSPMNVGRSVDEMLRTVRALQRSADGEAYTPADWRRAMTCSCLLLCRAARAPTGFTDKGRP